MNKILVYTVIAIFLGSVTMIVPLALLGPSKNIPDDNYPDTFPQSGGETFDNNDVLTDLAPSSEQSTNTESYDNSAKEPAATESKLRDANITSILSSIGLLILPSFLAALGVFIYLKKRMS
jgi:hypothetical protein